MFVFNAEMLILRPGDLHNVFFLQAVDINNEFLCTCNNKCGLGIFYFVCNTIYYILFEYFMMKII